jgi:nitrite reductase/ring-hydroxylating ferredoxin subunit
MITVFHIDDIDHESSKGISIGEDSYFAVKKDGEIYLYRNKCPHLGIELNWQEDKFLDMDGALIQCSTHGALFLIEDGECVSGPCLGERLESMPFDIIEGNIILST